MREFLMIIVYLIIANLVHFLYKLFNNYKNNGK